MQLIGDALLILGALSLFGERLVDRILTFAWPDVEAGGQPSNKYKRYRGITGIALVFCFGILVAFGFKLDLIDLIFPANTVGSIGGLFLTALLIGGGAAPAHEFVRYVENKKAKAKEEKAHAEAKTRGKV